jgi:hypothetical protein
MPHRRGVECFRSADIAPMAAIHPFTVARDDADVNVNPRAHLDVTAPRGALLYPLPSREGLEVYLWV